jgi:hypothetical protein
VAQRLGLATWTGGLAVFTESHWTKTTVQLCLRDERPAVDLADWDHAVESGIRVTGGAVRIFGPESTGANEVAVQIPSASYSIVVCGSGFGSTGEYGDDGSDTYTLWLWPGPVLPARRLKDGLERSS